MSTGIFKKKRGKQQPRKELQLLFKDATWLYSLSEPELDFLISLKQLAIHRSRLAGHRDLANKFDAQMLLAIGVTLLEHFKENLKSIPSCPMNADLVDKLPLLSTAISVNANLNNSTPGFATLKRKHTHDGLDDTCAESSKKQHATVKEEPVEY